MILFSIRYESRMTTTDHAKMPGVSSIALALNRLVPTALAGWPSTSAAIKTFILRLMPEAVAEFTNGFSDGQ